MRIDKPPNEAYGRVTDPERYSLLWDTADELIAGLLADYAVDRTDDVSLDPHLTDGLAGGVRRLTRLIPQTDGAGTLTVAYSGFPGLAVRFGRWHVERFPVCGCDACDEQPPVLATEFREHALALVAGEFSERLRQTPEPRLEYSYAGRESGSTTGMSLAETLADSEPLAVNWLAWPRA